jgi:hypothetical protein
MKDTSHRFVIMVLSLFFLSLSFFVSFVSFVVEGFFPEVDGLHDPVDA